MHQSNRKVDVVFQVHASKATDSSHEFSGTVLVDGNKCGQLIIHNISGVVYNYGDEPYGDENFDSLACVASDPELLDTCLYKLSNEEHLFNFYNVWYLDSFELDESHCTLSVLRAILRLITDFISSLGSDNAVFVVDTTDLPHPIKALMSNVGLRTVEGDKYYFWPLQHILITD